MRNAVCSTILAATKKHKQVDEIATTTNYAKQLHANGAFANISMALLSAYFSVQKHYASLGNFGFAEFVRMCIRGINAKSGHGDRG